MSVLIIHLSDIHIRGASAPIISRFDKICAAVASELPTAQKVLVMVSGDIAQSGQKDEYAAAKGFFDRLVSMLAEETSASIDILFVPGNHDCDFRQSNVSREHNIAGVVKGGSIDQAVIDACTAVQESFFAFQDSFSTHTEGDRLRWVYQFEQDGRRFEVVCLNVAWISKLREDKGLTFPFRRYEDVVGNGTDVRVTMLHHPLNWFESMTYRDFRRYLRQSSSLILTGHEHEGNSGLVIEDEAGQSAFVEGCALQHGNEDLTATGFFLVNIDAQAKSFTATRFDYSRGRYEAAKSCDQAPLRALPSTSDEKLELSAEFSKKMDDPGAITKLQSGFKLKDIYVFPHLRNMRSAAKVREFTDAKSLVDISFISDGVVLSGDERGGATSLLYQLYDSYYERGYVPVYINGADVKKCTPGELDSLVDKAIRDQYSASSRLVAKQALRSSRILLLDDWGDLAVQDSAKRAEYFSLIASKFAGFVACGNAEIETKELLGHAENAGLDRLKYYQLQPLGHVKRSELIQKWFSLSNDGSLNEGQFIGRCDEAEKLMAAVIQKSLIPSAPLYLMTLLLSAESGRSAELKESALGHYYQYLLSDALLDAGVAKAKLSEYFSYLSALAWRFHEKNREQLSYAEMVEFNAEFSAEWTTIDLAEMLKILQASSIIQNEGDDYSFRYPYMFYYLKGSYLKDKLDQADIKEYIARCCGHLYVRDNANTILFLAHHSGDEWLLNQMVGSLEGIFSDFMAVTFDGDVDGISRILSKAPALKYSGGSAVSNRRIMHERRDEMERNGRGGDGMYEVAEEHAELSTSAQLAMLIKNAEILGQVLKNQYSSIKRVKKRYIINKLFAGPMRALSRFYVEIEAQAESLRAAEDAAAGPTEASAQVAGFESHAVIAGLTQAITAALLLYASRSANSKDLAEDVHAVVTDNGTTAYKLIKLAAHLDSAESLPKALLTDIFDANKGSLAVVHVLRLLVIRRLYMFKTSEHDMQWINSLLGIDMATQHSITYGGNAKLH